MYKKFLIAGAASVFAFSAFASDMKNVKESYSLKDGSAVHIFNDGKMGMEDQVGRGMLMEEGHVMETKDGQKIVMKGNEFWRVENHRLGYGYE
ncbi:MAG: periplasmic Cu(I)/Cu(II)-binding protein CopK [Thiobacillus sp.]